MTWSIYPLFAVLALICWLGCSFLAWYGNRKSAIALAVIGILIYSTFISGLWFTLERPPLRTMGETRLWYAFFLAISGLLIYILWWYRWVLLCSGILSSIFVLINVFKPEISSTTLMPALQSPWFIPHVTVYILSYALLGVATIAAMMQSIKSRKQHEDATLYQMIDNVLYLGFGFLMLGMISGAIWAKEAWGHYWSWDPKETWAFITATAYLVCIHLRLRNSYNKLVLWMIPFSFVLLMVAWIGVNYLPSAQNSIHTYSKQN